MNTKRIKEIVEYAFNGLLPEKQNNCRVSQNVV